ncbi:MAG: hypothetical protein HZB46_11635, partial [Solirubrobacterales bacterium]|nr:hypothetical protein [Solirubrobacterales bacterium]
VASVAGAVAAGPLALAGLAVAAGAVAVSLQRTRRTRGLLPVAAPLDRVARAVADAYVALGELRPEAAASLVIEPRASGYLRVRLRDATPEESLRVTGALDALLGPVAAPRYVVSRLAAPPGGGLLGLALRGEPAATVVWHALPDDLGRHRTRADAFAQAWRRWLGPAELRFTQRGEGPATLAAAAAQEAAFDTRRRAVWV